MTCIYLASKAEEANIQIRDLYKVSKVKPKSIVSLEVPLLEGIHFNLRVYHPYRPLRGLFKLYSQYVEEKHPGASNTHLIKELDEKTLGVVSKLNHTDCCFVHTPGQIALAVFFHVAEAIKLPHVVGFRGTFLERAGSEEKFNAVVGSVEEYIALSKSMNIDMEDIKEIDKKVKACRNPFFDPDSKEYKKAAERKAQETQKRKIEKLDKDHQEAKLKEVKLLSGERAERVKKEDDGEFKIHSKLDGLPSRTRRSRDEML